jgi:hypothetical protein
MRGRDPDGEFLAEGGDPFVGQLVVDRHARMLSGGLSVGLSPALRVPGCRNTATNHPQKGDDTPIRFEKAEPAGFRDSGTASPVANEERGGSDGTGHSGAAGVTQ